MTNDAVITCTFHRTFTGDGNTTILNFYQQNFDNFYVLFDNHHSYSSDVVSKHYGGSDVCLYGDEDFIRYNFDKPINRSHRWGSHQNPKYFYAHFRMLVFYLKNPNYDYYWFFDDDVTFTGSLKDLLNNYSQDTEDFLAIQAFKKENYHEFPKISIINNRMTGSHGNWLSYCPGPGDVFKNCNKHIGCFFPIVRFSNRSMEYLLELHRNGYYGYSEGFVPSSLASNGFTVASMMDEFNQFFVPHNSSCTLFHKNIRFTWEWL